MSVYAVCVTSRVKPEHAEAFLAASRENARATRGESGNLRFDILRAEEDPARFFFYEVYRSREAFAAHQQTAHYVRWRDAVRDWMAEPRQGVRHWGVVPEAEAGW